jgi:hypothetical protein
MLAERTGLISPVEAQTSGLQLAKSVRRRANRLKL